MHGRGNPSPGKGLRGTPGATFMASLLACAVVAQRAHGTAARLQGRGRRVPGCCPKLPERVSYSQDSLMDQLRR